MMNPEKSNERSGAAGLVWHRARACAGGECVEVARTDGSVTIRNSGDPATTLMFTPAEWLEFVIGARAGDFDGLGVVGE